jgi:hypothetical protein
MGLFGVSFTYGITVDPTNLICAVIDRLISVILCECISHQAKANAKTPRYTSVSRRPGGIYLSRQSVKWQVAIESQGSEGTFLGERRPHDADLTDANRQVQNSKNRKPEINFSILCS